MKIPELHQTVMPYLLLYDPKQFIEFTTEVFAAEVIHRTNGESEDTIMHAEITIGGSTIMFGGASIQWKGQNANLFVYVEDVDEIYHSSQRFGATPIAEPENKDYGRTAGIQDPCGNTWWLTEAK